MFSLDMIQTLAFAGLVMFLGYGLRKIVPPLARYNLPAPVIGGFVVALVHMASRGLGAAPFSFDTALQTPLMTAFFTTIGFGSSLSLFKTGGPKIITFFIIATIFTLLQNAIGIAVAVPLGQHPLFGVLNSSATLVGGPATGLAFAPLFEKAGVAGASSMAVASAMTGIIFGGLIGAPIGTRLIERFRLKGDGAATIQVQPATAENVVENVLSESREIAPAGEDRESYVMLKSIVVILAAMWAGHWISAGFTAAGITLPGYIGAMFAGAIIRNLADVTGILSLSQRSIDDIGTVALALFIAMAMMTLKLWELAAVALPMLAVIAAQVLVVGVACFWPLFRLFGRDYDAAVTCAGFCGFMLGTTANAMASMESLAERYGPAPRAFLVVPIVGAFFIDFTNAIIITGFINFFR
ncbi:MAG: sodium/glutamate symporter [Spirochaetes bacterium]|nr:sodium/glutamate symporter [Spirochaetota bacterium]HPG51744.1 sodium/glutamate symporter [Spirochaetota bacterium]